jgi:hypothetical protein
MSEGGTRCPERVGMARVIGLGTSRSTLMYVDQNAIKKDSIVEIGASESRATIQDRCFGKDKEKAKMLRTLADPAGDASLWAVELAPSFS